MKTTKNTSWTGLVTGTVLLALSPALHALTPQETVSLQYMKQEEKLARDVYQALAARWEHPTFTRIAAAEQRHLSAVGQLLQQYGVEDTTPAEAGRFTIPELQALYDTLVSEGGKSLTAALQVGITIEETDLADLKEALAVTQSADLQRVFSNLSAASERHLRAFTTAAADPTTVPAQCTGNGPCPGRGTCVQGVQGKGPGRGQRAGACVGGPTGPGKDGTCPMGNTGPGTGAGTCPAANAGAVSPTPPAHAVPAPARSRNGQR